MAVKLSKIINSAKTVVAKTEPATVKVEVPSTKTPNLKETSPGVFDVSNPTSLKNTSLTTLKIDRGTTGTSAYTNPVIKTSTVSKIKQDTTTTKIDLKNDVGTVKGNQATNLNTKNNLTDTPNLKKPVDAESGNTNTGLLKNATDDLNLTDSAVLSKVKSAAKTIGVTLAGGVIGAGAIGAITIATSGGGSVTPVPEPVTQNENGEIVFDTGMPAVDNALSFLQDQINTIADVISDLISQLFGDENGENPLTDIPVLGDIIEWLASLFGGGGGSGGSGGGIGDITVPGTEIKVPAVIGIGLVVLGIAIAFAVIKNNKKTAGKKTGKKTNKGGRK